MADIDKNELVEEFCSITGADASLALRMLEACDGNLDEAIGMHMDTIDDIPAADDASTEEVSGNYLNEAENIREPIPQRNETLVKDSGNQFGWRNIRRAQSRSVFDGFRNFQEEAKFQESGASVSKTKRKTLEELFRPPIDMMFKGTFLQARDAGTQTNKWLLVNVQNVQEFQCQMLNRDVWSNQAAKDVIQSHFIFWQVYHDSEEGRKYMQFYNVQQWPYVSIIDPRTGENLVTWSNVDSLTFCDLVTEFLAKYPNLDGSSSDNPPSKRIRPECLSDEELGEKETSCRLVDASEDSQLEAAIRASLQQTSADYASSVSLTGDLSADENLEPDEEFDDEDANDLETFSDSERSSRHSVVSSSITCPPVVDSSRLSSPESCSSSQSSSHTQSSAHCTSNKPHNSLNNSQKAVSEQSQNSCLSSPFPTAVGSSTLNPSLTVKNKHKGVTNGVGPSDSDSSNQCSVDSAEKVSPAPSPFSSVADKNSHILPSKSSEKTDECSHLVLRLPDGKKKQVSLPASSTISTLMQHVSHEGYSKEDYELVTNFPRRQVTEIDPTRTLKESGLYPQETIFIQER